MLETAVPINQTRAGNACFIHDNPLFSLAFNVLEEFLFGKSLRDLCVTAFTQIKKALHLESFADYMQGYIPPTRKDPDGVIRFGAGAAWLPSSDEFVVTLTTSGFVPRARSRANRCRPTPPGRRSSAASIGTPRRGC